jgi:hypothetical protein
MKKKAAAVAEATDTPNTPPASKSVMAKIKSEHNSLVKKNISKNVKGSVQLDLQKIVNLRLKNKLSYRQIGAMCGVSKDTIKDRLRPLKRLLANPEAVENYRENRADYMDVIEHKLATQILDEDKLKTASVNNIAYAMAQLNNIGRLERGQSTANVQVIAGLSENDRKWLSDLCSQFSQRQLSEPGESGDVSG